MVENCYFGLRYPFWHTTGVKMTGCELSEDCRAGFWYSDIITIDQSRLNGVKALRECKNIKISKTDIDSQEFGWDCENVRIYEGEIKSEYFLMRSKNILMENAQMMGKYSFQYIENSTVKNCILNTKDAFWHSKNVTVKDTVIIGEYLGWYSESLTLDNCKIYGTQPLCYCKNLRLINCEMHDCDLAFEKSTVNAHITTPVKSIKNVLGGKITVPYVEQIIKQDERYQGIIEIKA